MTSGSPKVPLMSSGGTRAPGAWGRPGTAPGQEAGAQVILTGLMTHAAQDGAHLHPKVSLPFLQALAHQGHHLIGGEVPSVWGEE